MVESEHQHKSKNRDYNELQDEQKDGYPLLDGLCQVQSGVGAGVSPSIIHGIELLKTASKDDIASVFRFQYKQGGKLVERAACTYQDGCGDPDPSKGISIIEAGKVVDISPETCNKVLEGTNIYPKLFSSFD